VRILFSNPWLLLLLAAYASLLWLRWRQSAAGVPAFRRRLIPSLALHAVAALCLALGAAGLRIPVRAPHYTIAVAADISDSVFDVATQNARLNAALDSLDPAATDAAVVVFGRTAGLERALSPLAVSAAPNATPVFHVERAAPHVDLTRPHTVVDRSATDIGNALGYARGLLPSGDAPTARAILLLSDFRDTQGGAEAAAAALAGSGIDLLTVPAALGPSSDVRLAALRVPERGRVGRDLPIEAVVAAQSPCTVRVAVWRQEAGEQPTPVDFKTIALSADAALPGAEIRQLVRVLDRPAAPGVATYSVRVSGSEGELPGDILINNQLAAAVRVTGPSRWAVLTRPGSTLARLAADKTQPLGVETDLIYVSALPKSAAAYATCAGILVDGLSAQELDDGPCLRALDEAVGHGKALLAVGGEQAFGAGGHRDGAWQRRLPVEMTPEDDRTRSILFLIDVSKSMEQRMSRDESLRKIDFAAEQLATAVQKLRPADRLGLIAFSGAASVATPLSLDPSRAAFLTAVRGLTIQANTDLLPPLKRAQELLADDDAQEQLVVMLSDGVQTAATPGDEIVAAAKTLCPPPQEAGKPRRTTLYTFGIGVRAQDADPNGEKMLKQLADAGGGWYSPEFLKLAERLEQAFTERRKDFYVRRDPCALRPIAVHPLFSTAGVSPAAWPVLPFRNRVKAKATAEVVMWGASVGDTEPRASASGKAKPDPLLTVSGSAWSGVSRRAALAVSLDGDAGTAWMADASSRKLLLALLAWLEARPSDEAAGWTLSVEPGADDTLAIEVRATDPVSKLPVNGRKLRAVLAALDAMHSSRASASVREPFVVPLHPSAPGAYRALLPKPAEGVYRLAVEDDARPVTECFVTVPYPAELHRFGTDRAAMQKLVALSADSARGASGSRIIERPEDLARWAAEKRASRETYSLRPWLIALGLALLLVEYAIRGRRT
jgi:hypothetical protein